MTKASLTKELVNLRLIVQRIVESMNFGCRGLAGQQTDFVLEQ